MSIFQSKTGKQTAILFGSQIAMIAIGFGIKTIQTKYLGPEGYGLYAFFGTFTGFAILFFRFGFFSSLQVLLAKNQNIDTEKELFGLGFILNFAMGILFALFMWVCSYFVDDWFSIEIGWIFRLIAPLTTILPTRSLVSAMTVGSNRVHILPIYDNVSKLLFIIALLVFAYGKSLTVFNVILFNLLTLLISLGVIYRQFNPSFKNLLFHFSSLWTKNKEYGFNFYIGSTASQSTFKLDEIIISYFINTTVNGFYTLANVIASPLVMGSQALSNSLFKEFSSQNRIPKKVFLYNTLWLIISISVLYFISEWIVSLLFGSDYTIVSQYAIGISIAFFFQGLYQPFNFLSAKSQGKAVRNVPVIEAIINLVGNLALIPIYGVMGAIYTSIFAKFIHFIGKYYYYKKYINNTSE